MPDISPSRVRVRVLNGSGAEGQAGQAAQALQSSGFILAGTGDAEKEGYTDSVIRYGRGQEDKAMLLKAYLGGGAQVEQDDTLRGVDLVLVTGSAFTGVQAPDKAGATTSSTTTTTTPGVTPGKSKAAATEPPC